MLLHLLEEAQSLDVIQHRLRLGRTHLCERNSKVREAREARGARGAKEAKEARSET
jgi:hypothetical protein